MPAWVGPKKIIDDDNSWDEGKSYETLEAQQLFGCYFFLSSIKISHKYSSQTILDILAGFGGMYRLVCMYIAIIAGYFNSKVLMAKVIRGLYFLKKPKENKSVITLTSNSYFRKLITVKVDYFNYCFKYSRSRD